jgi:hypothetical protein
MKIYTVFTQVPFEPNGPPIKAFRDEEKAKAYCDKYNALPDEERYGETLGYNELEVE